MPPEFINSNWIQNYFFVALCATDKEYVYRDGRRKSTLSGALKVRLTTADHVFIGNGFQELEDGKFVKQTLMEDGKAIIPGSGLKGTVRQICRAVSHSCVPNDSCDLTLPKGAMKQCALSKRSEDDHACIVCDMFGKPGWNSKVFFSDLKAENTKTELVCAAHPFLPHPEAEKYLVNGCHAYKFYKTKIDDVTKPQTDHLRAVMPDTVFSGEITYQNLNEEELGLLLFGLGGSGTISLKIGGYRNEGFGTVNIALDPEPMIDISELINNYIESLDDDLRKIIGQLEAGMPYKA